MLGRATTGRHRCRRSLFLAALKRFPIIGGGTPEQQAKLFEEFEPDRGHDDAEVRRHGVGTCHQAVNSRG